MLMTRIVQGVLFAGVGTLTILAIRLVMQDIREHREDRLGEIPVDYDGEIRRTMAKR